MPEENSLYATKGRWSRIGYIVTHVSIILVVLGAVVGKVNGFKGFMEIQEGQVTPWYWNRTINHEDKFDFALRLDKLTLEFYPPEFYLRVNDLTTQKLLLSPKVDLGGKFHLPGTKIDVQVVDYRPDFRLENRRDYTAKPDFPAIQVKYFQDGREMESGWVTVAGENFPAPTFAPNLYISLYNLYTERPKDYKSALSVIDKQGRKVMEKTIEVNDPLRYQGITFYQSSFDKENRTTGLQVAKDPASPSFTFSVPP